MHMTHMFFEIDELMTKGLSNKKKTIQNDWKWSISIEYGLRKSDKTEVTCFVVAYLRKNIFVDMPPYF